MKIFWDSYGIIRGPSGIFVHAQELHRALSESGMMVSILGSVPPSNPLRNAIYQFAKKSKVLGPQLNYLEFRRATAGADQTAIFHGLSNINLPAWTGFSSPTNVRFVLTVHDLIPLLLERGAVSHASRIQMKRLLPRVLERANAIIAVSGWTKKTLVDHYPDCAEKITVIPNGFPAWEFFSRPANPQSSQIRVLMVGRNEKYKRHDLFFKILLAANGSLRGTLVTTGISAADKGAADLLAAKNWLKIVKDPSKETLKGIYQANDVYVQTSVLEGFCLPAAEAQASGIPVVFTKGSGIDEVVCPRTGMGLEATATAEAWVDAIHKTDARFLGLGLALHEWVLSHPTWNDSAIQLKNLYNSL